MTFLKKIFSRISNFNQLNYKNIPIIIISFNQFYYLKKQIDFY